MSDSCSKSARVIPVRKLVQHHPRNEPDAAKCAAGFRRCERRAVNRGCESKSVFRPAADLYRRCAMRSGYCGAGGVKPQRFRERRNARWQTRGSNAGNISAEKFCRRCCERFLFEKCACDSGSKIGTAPSAKRAGRRKVRGCERHAANTRREISAFSVHPSYIRAGRSSDDSTEEA